MNIFICQVFADAPCSYKNFSQQRNNKIAAVSFDGFRLQRDRLLLLGIAELNPLLDLALHDLLGGHLVYELDVVVVG